MKPFLDITGLKKSRETKIQQKNLIFNYDSGDQSS